MIGKSLAFFSFVFLSVSGVLLGDILMEKSFDTPEDMKKCAGYRHLRILDSKAGGKILKVTTPENYDGKGFYGLSYPLATGLVAGRNLRISVDIKREIFQAQRWEGGKLMLAYKAGGRWHWPGVHMALGKFDWESKTLQVEVPVDVEQVTLFLGIQSGRGTIWFRKLRMTSNESFLDLAPYANRGYVDAVAGDGKGGWSDQGPLNDAGNFQFRRKRFGGIPFRPVNPAANGGKSVVVFKSSRVPDGVSRAEVDLGSAHIAGRYLYLLHTLCWGSNHRKPVGHVRLVGKNGTVQTIAVRAGLDVADWWQPGRRSNAFPGAIWQNGDKQTVGAYVTRFKLDPKLGELKQVDFLAGNDSSIWLLLAATISQDRYDYPVQTQVKVVADKVWHPLPVPEQGGVIPGSALDISACFDTVPAGSAGPVIINSQGHFAFQHRPEQAVRFMTAVVITDPFGGREPAKPEFTSKKNIEAYATQLRLQGYNMVRFHFLDAVLMSGSKQDFVFNKRYLDMFDYFVFCMKKNGIYVNIDAMASRIGWAHGYSWSAAPGDRRYFKLDIYFDPQVRKNWETGVRTLLTRINPYTGIRLVDDPVLALAVSYNEQEFAFFQGRNFQAARTDYLDYLRRRYQTIDALKKSWGTCAKDYGSFDDIPVFSAETIVENSARGKDVGRFIGFVEKRQANWYRETLRGMGYKGFLANFNMGQNLRYVDVREEDDLVALNGYHAHPFSNAMDTEGAISQTARLMRGFASVRPYGKPLIITEHGHMFWNSYRYEQGLVDGGYAALQDFDGLAAFANQISIFKDVHPIQPCSVSRDPILKAAELQTAFLFRRGDVQAASSQIRVQVDTEAMYSSGAQQEALHTGQAHLALVTGFSVEPSRHVKALENQFLMPAAGGSALLIREQASAGNMQTVDAKDLTFDFPRVLKQLKTKGLLPKGNRTDHSKGIYESATGEIFLDAPRHFMSIDTPRFQGICGEAGTKVRLSRLGIHEMTTRGTVSAISLQNDRDLGEASRIVLVYATNVLNSGMVFDNQKHRTRIQNGKTPLLVETGAVQLTLKHRHGDSLKLYALSATGKRMEELPLRVDQDGVHIHIDTAKLKTGPALYFELCDR